jgi:hypothetical protein
MELMELFLENQLIEKILKPVEKIFKNMKKLQQRWMACRCDID